MLRSPFHIAFLVGFVVYVVIRHHFESRTHGRAVAVRRVDGIERALLALALPGTLVIPVVFLFTRWLAFADLTLPAALPWVGCVVLVAALWLFWRAHADLDRNWSMTLEIRADHELVTTGVYRRVRHPMYTAIWLFGAAQALLLDNWIAGPSALVAFAPLYFVRTPREERLMLDHFGEAYGAYMATTGRLLPRRGAGQRPGA